MVGWNACGTGGKGDAGGGGEEMKEIYDRPRACSRGRTSLALLFRARDGLLVTMI